MKVIILAAGSGKRFRSIHLPKPLTMLANGKSILQLQLESLSQYLSLDKVIIVVGYNKEKVLDQFPDLLYVYNNLYAKQNTSKSLLKALQKLEKDEDVLWINGDVVFHHNILKLLLSKKKNCMAVNSAQVGEEEVKYRTNSKGLIVEVSKTVQNAEGEAVGINFFQASSVPTLIKNLEQCEEQDYFEKGIEGCIKEGIEVSAVNIGKLPCVEIDFPEDLKKANQLLWT